MVPKSRRLKLGVIGCGAIGSRIAVSTTQELKDRFTISALYDIDLDKARALAKRLQRPSLFKASLAQAVLSSDMIVEAVNTPATRQIVQEALAVKKGILVMSVGRLLEESGLFSLAEKKGADLLVPSGAIAGLDAIKAARLKGIRSVTLTTTKPPEGFSGNPFLVEKGIDLSGVVSDAVLFEGKVRKAVRLFPQNINVAAALSLAVGDPDKVKVKIIASPLVKRNVHEIKVEGAFGRIVTRVENEVCPDNPKTSYLAVLSAIATLKGYADRVKIGT